MTTDSQTLLFCTSYMDAESWWQGRYRPWVDYYQALPLRHDATFMLDDASPYLPDDPRVVVLHELPTIRPTSGQVQLYRFPEHLSNKRFRGWWRSFLFSLEIARTYGFRKIVHIESDAYLLSQQVVDYVNELDSGWTTLWCPIYQMPESQIQVIGEDQFPSLQRLVDMDSRELRRKPAEKILPFTHVEKRFHGNRYGEYLTRIPRTADFACQVHASIMSPRFKGV